MRPIGRQGRNLLFLSSSLQSNICSMQVFTSLLVVESRKDTAKIGEIKENADAMFHVPTSRLANDCEITRLSVGQPCTCTIRATLFDLEVKHRNSFPSWQHDRPADVETFSAGPKKRAAPAPKWKLEKRKKTLVRGSELRDRLKLAVN